MMAVLDPGTTAAGVLTRSKTCSAPVLWCREGLKQGKARALVVNSGNANAFTGKKGAEATRITAEAAAKAVGCSTERGLRRPRPASSASRSMPASSRTCSTGWRKSAKRRCLAEAARAIMTTDTFPKLATRKVRLGSADVVINGFAKGAGMIAPDLATMLVYIFTDAAIAQPALQAHAGRRRRQDLQLHHHRQRHLHQRHRAAVRHRRGRRARRAVDRGRRRAPTGRRFAAALHDLMHELALWVVKDGEGLTKFVTIDVTGAESDMAARRIGFAIANSPLVKTAIAGEDPNWGRVVMAVGKSGEAADRDRLSITYGDIVGGQGRRARRHLRREDGGRATWRAARSASASTSALGAGKATVWTCDLTHDYISINADYRS